MLSRSGRRKISGSQWLPSKVSQPRGDTPTEGSWGFFILPGIALACLAEHLIQPWRLTSQPTKLPDGSKRGAARIRTGDGGFAIHCLSHLATAPRRCSSERGALLLHQCIVDFQPETCKISDDYIDFSEVGKGPRTVPLGRS